MKTVLIIALTYEHYRQYNLKNKRYFTSSINYYYMFCPIQDIRGYADTELWVIGECYDKLNTIMEYCHTHNIQIRYH